MRPVGYLWNTKDGPAGRRPRLSAPRGEPGVFYDYIVAENGIFVQARGPLLEARVRIAEATVRGISPLHNLVQLPHGKIPRHLYDLAVAACSARPGMESYLAIQWENGYRLAYPGQKAGPAHVSYDRLPNTVVDIHSHGAMGAFFSETDNQDEQGLGLYLVVGRAGDPEVMLRVGVYGYFAPVPLEEVFQ